MATFRPFRVIMPSELRYWTVLDPTYRVVVEADDFLLHHRLGRDGAGSTSQSYATSLALFFDRAASIHNRGVRAPRTWVASNQSESPSTQSQDQPSPSGLTHQTDVPRKSEP